VAKSHTDGPARRSAALLTAGACGAREIAPSPTRESDPAACKTILRAGRRFRGRELARAARASRSPASTRSLGLSAAGGLPVPVRPPLRTRLKLGRVRHRQEPGKGAPQDNLR